MSQRTPSMEIGIFGEQYRLFLRTNCSGRECAKMVTTIFETLPSPWPRDMTGQYYGKEILSH
jgi:hypothetical protein